MLRYSIHSFTGYVRVRSNTLNFLPKITIGPKHGFSYSIGNNMLLIFLDHSNSVMIRGPATSHAVSYGARMRPTAFYPQPMFVNNFGMSRVVVVVVGGSEERFQVCHEEERNGVWCCFFSLANFNLQSSGSGYWTCCGVCSRQKGMWVSRVVGSENGWRQLLHIVAHRSKHKGSTTFVFGSVCH